MDEKTIITFVFFLFAAFFGVLAPVDYAEAQNIGAPNVPDPTPDQSNTAPVPVINSPREACRAYRTDSRFFVNNVFLKDTDEECLIQVGDNNIGYGKVDFYFKGNEFCVASTGDYFTRINGGGTSCKPVKKQIKHINGGSVTLDPIEAGVPYRHDFSQELISLLGGGSDPAIYSFYLGSGIGFPPMGLTFGTDGVLSGTPSGKGGTFQACVRDLNGNSACRTYTIDVEKDGEGAQTDGQPSEGDDVSEPQADLGQDIGFHYGGIEIIREGISFPANNDIRVFPGDTVKTGPDGFLELVSNGRTVRIGSDTLGRMLGFDMADGRVTVPRDWDTDPEFKNKLDDLEFWRSTLNDLKDFINENAPIYAIDCGLNNIIGCPWGMLEFIHSGTQWFDEKMAKDFGKSIVVTPTAVVVPVATEFTVQVNQDGATTLTVLEGAAVLMDLKSKKSAIVEVNQQLMVPKTDAGLSTAELQQRVADIDPATLDRWWDKKPASAPNSTTGILNEKNMIIGSATIFGLLMILILLRQKPAKK